MRCYFNFQDGATFFDNEGTVCPTFEDAKTVALQCSFDVLPGPKTDAFWSGEPWRLWVTDQPNGGGRTVLTLTFGAHCPA